MSQVQNGNASQSEYAVEISNLNVKYVTSDAVVHAVNGIDLQLKRGTILGLVGETGAGKTTTVLSLLRLIPAPPGVVNADYVRVNGMDVLSMSDSQLERFRGKEIAMIFQDPMTSLNPVMRVGDQIAESILLHQKVNKRQAAAAAGEMLKTVGIDPARAREYPHQFSGGMRQRVGIAIALACKPSVLIADEPTTALDVTIQAQVLKLTKDLKQQYNTSMILITHDLGVVAKMCDEVAIMYAGEIVEQGTLEQVFRKTLHPYTEGLFDSLPNIRSRVNRLKPIRGLMPDPSNLPNGCAFTPRCPYACPQCAERKPTRLEMPDGHLVKCSRYAEPNFSIERRR